MEIRKSITLPTSNRYPLNPLIEVKQLTKRFENVTAVDGIDFSVLQGELFGFLGPNGAGKTTTINILTGLARPDLGTIRIDHLSVYCLPPIPLELLMLAKTSGAILFGAINASVPIILALFLTDLSQVDWIALFPAVVMIAIASTFFGLFIAISVSEVFEAQIFSNFFRFPMIFRGLFKHRRWSAPSIMQQGFGSGS